MSFSDQPRTSEPEYLGGDADGSRSRRRVPLVALASVGVLGVVAAGGWAALNLMSTGAQPASVVPAGAVAYASVDLDPAASQKIEAIRMIQKFPALDQELGLDAQEDLRRWAFEEMTADSCPTVDYDEDVAPWIGDRAAVAVLPGKEEGSEPVPMVALQVTDADAANDALDLLAACSGEEAATSGSGDFGHAFANDYLVIAETTGTAEEIVVAAEDAALGDDETYLRWTTEAGDPGIAMLYVAPEAVTALSDAQDEAARGLGNESLLGGGFVPGFGAGAELERLAEDFEGVAGILRFDDGSVEVEVAGAWLPEDFENAGPGTGVGALPASTGAAFAFAMPDGWGADTVDRLNRLAGGMSLEDMLNQAEAATGLELPDDVETLLGDGFSVALDSSVDPSTFAGADPTSLPAGVRVVGDPDEILPIVEKIQTAWGPGSEALVVEPGDGAVAFGMNPAYVSSLAGEGDLGDEESFRAVVPDADVATAVMYVGFDAGDGWLERTVVEVSAMFWASDDDSAKIRENMDPLDAVGMSSWVDGDVVRATFRISTD
jgi:hypothetical protein